MVKDGIMNQVIGIWADIKKIIIGENKMQKKPIKKYMVMSKFKSSDRFNLEKQFVNKHSADAYVGLMIEDKEYENIEYFLFEQSHDYQHIEENPIQDLKEVVNG
tara:strand:+ start:23 stop:334 length:312 start_codon:yes stop_codon:yes gene_type:complete